MDDPAIKVENVSKIFKLPHEKNTSIKSAVVNFYRRNKGYDLQKALNGVSFEVKQGEFFGIVGRNGSGKSTMLKLLAGIYSPTEGNVQVNGSLTPFIELGVGFNAELTGRENVFLNGALLGFNRKEMRTMYNDIVEFAELKKFMDQKLKNYSSGMQVRLAFSIAIRAKSDILLIDEVLAVGDADFQRKCLRYFATLKQNKKTVVFVSHDMESVKNYCDRVILIESGEVKAEGAPQAVISKFMSSFIDDSKTGSGDIDHDRKKEDLPLGISYAVSVDKTVLGIKKVSLQNSQGKAIKTLDKATKEYTVSFVIEAHKDSAVVPGVIISNELGEFVVAANSKWQDNKKPVLIKAGKKYLVKFKMANIYELGNYFVSVNVVSDDLKIFYAWANEARSMFADRPYQTGGKVNPECVIGVTEL
jgi:ABC-2 type transport system ATP-binding protein